MGIQIMVYLFNGMFYSNKKELNFDTCNVMLECHKQILHKIKQKKDCIFYDSTIQVQEQAKIIYIYRNHNCGCLWEPGSQLEGGESNGNALCLYWDGGYICQNSLLHT